MNWKDLWNKKYLMISVYVLLTALLYHLGSRLVDHLERIPSLWTRHFSWLSQVTSPLLLGFALAYLLSPLCSILERALGKIPLFQKKEKLRRNLGILLCYLLILLFLVLLASLFVSVLTKNIQLIQGEDFAKGLESVLLLLKSFYEDLNQRVSEIPIAGNDLQEGIRTFLAKLLSFVQNLGSNFISSVGNMGSLIGTLLFGIIFSIYFLADGVKIALYWERIFRLILGEKRVLAFRGFLKDADRAFSGYIRGQMIDGIIMAILVSFSLSLIGVRYAVAIGILTGIGNLIPYVGPFVAYGTTILVCTLYGDFSKLLPAVLALFAIQTIDGNVINPRLLSNSIDIHPLLVIISLIIGGAVGGVLGIFLAAPIASLIKLQVDRMIERGEAKKKTSQY